MRLKGISDNGLRRIAQGLRGFEDTPENYTDSDVLALDIKFIDFLISRLNEAREITEGPEGGESVFKRFDPEAPDWQRDEVVRDILDGVVQQIVTRLDLVDNPRDPGAESFGAE